MEGSFSLGVSRGDLFLCGAVFSMHRHALECGDGTGQTVVDDEMDGSMEVDEGWLGF